MQLLEISSQQEVKAKEYNKLLDLIVTRKAKMGIIGLGYVGLPEAVEFAKAGFSVTGIDIDRIRVDRINKANSYIQDVNSSELTPLLKDSRLQATTDFSCLSQLDTINICVPTPLRKSKDPDLSYIIAAIEEVKKYLHRGQLIILESTTYPGTTEEILLPILSESGLKVGEDFFLAFSPERIDPGNQHYTTTTIPKVVGGLTPQCTRLAAYLYQQAVETVIKVSSSSIAEMVKLLENTFRSVNIGLVNEIALMCHALKLNVWEVIEAAATKPFGFMPFYPGPGVGGHCIPLDPFYLSWKARMHGFEPRFIDLAGQINSQMPAYVVSRIADALNDQNKCLRNSKIHIMGVTYKPNISDVRESPALKIIQLLKDKGTIISYSDPYAPILYIDGTVLKSTELTTKVLRENDCILILTNHDLFDYLPIVHHAQSIVDTRNALHHVNSAKIVRL